MTDAWRMVVRSYGGPEVFERESFVPREPGDGELLIAQEAIGLNFIDTYHRSGLYPSALPITPGSESAGRVIAVGAGVSGFSPGDRIGTVKSMEAYATHRLVPAAAAVRLPDHVSSQEAAAAMLKGFTACYLSEDMIPLGPGQSVLVHSAAGGVGSFLVPWLRDKGVVVIAHSGSAEKAAAVEADHSLTGPFGDLAEQVRDINGGRGVDVVYDGVGRDAWETSLASLRKFGLMVSFGNASGEVPPVSLLDLMRRGSLYVSRPTLFDYVAAPADLARTAERLFDRLKRGVVKTRIGQTFGLENVAEAHRALESRATQGSTILLP